MRAQPRGCLLVEVHTWADYAGHPLAQVLPVSILVCYHLGPYLISGTACEP